MLPESPNSLCPAPQRQPYFTGSNFTLLSILWIFQRQTRLASRQSAFSTYLIVGARLSPSPTATSVNSAKALAQPPSASSPTNAGQLPAGLEDL